MKYCSRPSLCLEQSFTQVELHWFLLVKVLAFNAFFCFAENILVLGLLYGSQRECFAFYHNGILTNYQQEEVSFVFKVQNATASSTDFCRNLEEKKSCSVSESLKHWYLFKP